MKKSWVKLFPDLKWPPQRADGRVRLSRTEHRLVLDREAAVAFKVVTGIDIDEVRKAIEAQRPVVGPSELGDGDGLGVPRLHGPPETQPPLVWELGKVVHEYEVGIDQLQDLRDANPNSVTALQEVAHEISRAVRPLLDLFRDEGDAGELLKTVLRHAGWRGPRRRAFSDSLALLADATFLIEPDVWPSKKGKRRRAAEAEGPTEAGRSGKGGRSNEPFRPAVRQLGALLLPLCRNDRPCTRFAVALLLAALGLVDDLWGWSGRRLFIDFDALEERVRKHL